MSIDPKIGYKNRVVMIYDKDEFPVALCNTITEAAKFLGVRRESVSSGLCREDALIGKSIVRWVKV